MFLDSAVVEDVRSAARLGYVSGITLNPLLLNKAEVVEPIDHLHTLLRTLPRGPVLYQPLATDVEEAETEARRAHEVDHTRVGIKLLAMPPFFEVAHQLIADGVPCAMTGVYTPAQAVLAHDVGCKWVIPYVDRAIRLLPNGSSVVGDMRAALQAKHSAMLILSASIKTPQQALQTLLDGADEVSTSLEVLQQLALHELTASALDEFDKAAKEIEQRWRAKG